jgi:AraC-like DNA-binding protein
MKPHYERIAIPDDCSIRVYHRQLAAIPFEWHQHPEYELTLTLNSRGRRFIGDHLADYTGDDLVLVPPNLPHTWASNTPLDATAPQVAVVLWFTGDWARRVADCCPEYAGLRTLLRRAASGLAFGAAACAAMRAHLPALLSPEPRARLGAALDLLAELADTGPDATPLAVAAAAPRGALPEAERLDRVLDLLDRRFHEPLRLAELAAAAHCSTRSLQRRFELHVGASIRDYLQRVRVAHAARQLVATDWPVALIAARSGFPSLANFNRQFRAARGMSPRAYRQCFAAHVPAAAHPAATLDQRPPSLERRAAARKKNTPTA